MKLSGHYTLEDLVRTLQGNFSCQYITKNSKGKALAEADQHIRLELFFVRFEIFKTRVEIYKSDSTGDGEKLTKICTLPVAAS